jgi:actin-like ATPase involved in cell morphogenesis
MPDYALGVDLGTTYTAAAIGRGSTATTLQLGTDSAAAPSVVVFRDDGEVLVGDPAERRAASEPDRSVREFKRRLGDPVPVVVGGEAHSVEALMAAQLRSVVRHATEQEGQAPSTVVLTHPANYTGYKLDKLREVATLAGLEGDRVVLLAEPEAAAIAYSQGQRIEVGEVIAVYDFGGGTFDAAVLRRSATGFELLGVPEGMERLGGIDFDQAVVAHVDDAVGGLVSSADRNDPQTLPGQARLRVDARRAKEALSTDSDTAIAVAIPGVNTEVRLTRSEFEAMVRPRIAQTITALERTVASAGLTITDVSRVLLVGGTSRMPIVAELVGSATGRPVSVDTHPKLAIATGAALAGAATLAAPAVGPEAAWQAPTRVAPPASSDGRARRRPVLIFLGIAAVGLVAAGVILFARGGDDDATDPAATAPAATEPGGVVPTEPAATAPAVTDPPGGPSTAPTPPTEPTAPTTPDVPVDGPVVVTELSDDAVAMGTAANGAVLVLTSASQVLAVGDDGSTTVVSESVAAVGPIGGIAEGAGGLILATTPDGVVDLTDGSIVVAADAVGLGPTPGPISIDGAGSAYVADNDNRRIIRRAPDGTLSLVAGNGVDGGGAPPPAGAAATDVAIGDTSGLGVDAAGRLLLVQRATGAVLAVAQDGTISTSTTGVPAGLSGPAAVGRDGAIWLGAAREISRVSPA